MSVLHCGHCFEIHTIPPLCDVSVSWSILGSDDLNQNSPCAGSFTHLYLHSAYPWLILPLYCGRCRIQSSLCADLVAVSPPFILWNSQQEILDYWAIQELLKSAKTLYTCRWTVGRTQSIFRELTKCEGWFRPFTEKMSCCCCSAWQAMLMNGLG